MRQKVNSVPKPEKDERGDGEHDAGGQRFACGAGGLHDVIFEDGGAAEGAQDADGEHGDGDGGGDGETGAQADVDGDRAEEESEERAEDNGANGEFGEGLVGGDVGAEFAGRRGGTPGTIAHENPPSAAGRVGMKRCAGIMPQEEGSGEGYRSRRGLAARSLDSSWPTG